MINALYIAAAIVITLPVLGKSFYTKKNLPGAVLCFLIAIPAWYLGKKFSVVGASVFGIVFGMLLANVKRPEYLNSGIKITGKKVLQAAVVLFGFEMNMMNVIKAGTSSFIVILCSISASFLTSYFIGRLLKVERKTATLIGTGTAICGGSAIAAASPVIKADEETVATAISTIFLFNLLAVFIFPAVGHVLKMSDTTFGIWAGTAINDTSSVVAAGFSYSDEAGNLATIVKLTRTLMIVPVTCFLAFYTAKSEKKSGEDFKLSKVFPWFVLGFIAACIINTTGVIPADMSKFLGKAGKFMIVAAMTAIGLNTDVVALIKNGKRPIFLGLCCWFMVAAVSLVAQNVFL